MEKIRKIGLSIFLIFMLFSLAMGETIWSEDFNTSADQGKGAYGSTITSPSSGKWSVNVDNCTLADDNDWFKVNNNLFEARDLDGTQVENGGGEGAIWTSESINITGYTNVTISVDVSEAGAKQSKDFIKASYKIDSGSITQFGLVYDDFENQKFTINDLSGSSLTIYVEADNNLIGDYLYFDNVLVTGTISYTVNPPTSFTASASSISQINLSWTNNAGSDDVIVVFDSDGSFTDPVDGTSYSGSALGGTVIYQGSAESYSHTSLSASTHYYYKAWSVDGSDNYSSGVTDDATTNAPTSVDEPTSFSATTATSSQINLSWTQNGDTDDVMVVFDSDGSFTDPSDGTSYSLSSSTCGGTVIFNGSATSYNHTSLSGDTHYYYKAWSVDGSNNYSSGVTDNATTLKAEPTNHASSFTSTSTDTSITLNWNDNDGSVSADNFLIKASSTSLVAISAPSDGSTESDDSDLSDGSAVMNVAHGSESYTFTGLSSETTYYFKIWPLNNTASNVDYKTDGSIPNVTKVTTQTVSDLLDLSFESSGGYSTSITEYTDGGDYFLRTNGSNIESDIEFGNTQGSYYFAAQNIDGTLPVTLTINDVDISGQKNLNFSIYLAEDDDGSKQDWDNDDYLHIDYDIDNSGTFTNLIHVEGSGGLNTEPKLDTNFDGTGNGTAITATFTKFSEDISGTGSSIDIKLTFYLNLDQEDIAVDNIRLTGLGAVANPSSFSASPASTSQINLSWTNNVAGDEVLVVFDSDGSFTDPVDGTSYSGSALGGTVIYKGSAESYSHTSLSASTHYYYKAWSVDGSDNYSSGVTDDATTNAPTSVDDPTSFSATTATISQINLSWTQNGDTDDVMVVFDSDGSFTDPSDGTSYSLSSSACGGTVIFNGSTTSYNHTSLSGGTHYYYKAWSVDGSNNYSSGVTDNATTLKAEPSNHASNFISTSTDTSITLNWNDNDGSVSADNFLIKASSTSLVAISAPSDGSTESDDSNLSDGSAVMNVAHGSESYTFTGLSSETTYYFKIWALNNTASNVDYKTDGSIPSVTKATAETVSYLLDLSFESSGGYSTSITEYTDGGDYFLRTNGSDINSNVEFGNTQGSYYFAAQNIDGTLPVTLTINDVDISDQKNLNFSIYLAEDDDGSNQDWDDDDYLHIDYDIDNSGTFTNLIHVEGSGDLNTEPKLDTNFDGTGNGTAITATFTKFSEDISGTGSSIDIKLTFYLNLDQEDIAIDNIRLTGSEIIADPSSFSTSPASTSQINLSWTKNDDANDVMVVYNASGTFTAPVDGTSYSVSSSACSGSVIYNGSGTSYNHTGLDGGTHYYYKAFSVNSSTDYSFGITGDITTIKNEPSNHASNFISTSTDTSITLNWNDNDGSVTADGFIIKASSTSLVAINAPSDGSTESDDSNLSDGSALMNIAHGSESYTFTGLSTETTYYFKIYSYSNSSSDINYKTDGSIPSVTRETAETVSNLLNLSFESPGGYSTSITEFTDNSSNYFLRTNGSNINSNVEFGNTQGSYYFAAQNISGNGASLPVTLTINDVDISGKGNLNFSIYLAEDDDGSQQDWDDDDYLHIDYDIDNSGTFTNLIHVEGSGGSDTEPKIDTNFDGTGNGTAITGTFTKFSEDISKSGSLIDIKLTFYLNDLQEDIVIDNIMLTGFKAIEDPNSLTASTISTSQINLSWTKNNDGDHVMIVYDTDSTFSDPMTGSTYSVSSSACGGTVIYNGSGTAYNHTSLSNGTHYYYKAWSVSSDTSYSRGIVADAATIKIEPSNHVASFLGDSNYKSVTLTWTDNNGTSAADGFLIKGSTTSLAAIANPTDGTEVSNDPLLADGSGTINISTGVQTYTWTGLSPETDYYFKIYPYSNSGSDINYKTDGLVPSGSISTSDPVKIMITEIMQNPADATDLYGEWFELYNAGTETVNIDGWTITDNGSDSHTINNGDTLNIPANEFIVLGIDANSSTNGNYSCDYQFSSFRLDNTADEIILKDGNILIDSIAYDGGPNWPDPLGESMMFIGKKDDDNNLYSNWGTATVRENGFSGTSGDKGSPGANGSDQALPVTLGFFEGNYIQGVIELRWRTESETHNSRFLIYRDDEVIGTLEGAGTTAEPHDYLFTDLYVIPGITYQYILADISYMNEETRHEALTVDINTGDDMLVGTYAVGKAYPNPFNPVTLIPLTFTEDTELRAILYNLNGQKIKVLANDTFSPGKHSLRIGGHNLATGMYIVQIIINNEMQLRKITLMK